MAVFSQRTRDRFRVLEVAGSLVHSDSEGFRKALECVSRPGVREPVIIDLSSLDWICSAGMRLLVQCERALDKNDLPMMTVGLQGNARETIEICGIDKLLSIAPTVDAAIEELRASGRA